MKFTHQLKFNSVPEWRAYYINYAGLKKLVYAIAQAESNQAYEGHEELGQPLLSGQPSFGRTFSRIGSIGPGATEQDAEAAFIKALDHELTNVISFLHRKEGELLSGLEALDLEAHSYEGLPTTAAEGGDTAQQDRIAFWAQPARHVVNERERLRLKLSDLYVQLTGLIDFLDLNSNGFRKILKKHDKVTSQNLRASYWPVVESKLQPANMRPKLDNLLKTLVNLGAVVCFKGDTERAVTEMKRQLRDHITFERNTVWRDMVAMERRSASTTLEQAPMKRPNFFVEHARVLSGLLALAVFGLLLDAEFFPEPEKNNCLALLVLASMLWATEAVPLFVTSMIVPFMVVVLRCLVDNTTVPPTRLEPDKAAPVIFHAMFSQVVMLLLGGFSIAAALSKHFIAKQMAIAILSRVGRRPESVLLATMFVATFLSMWISNVAAPVLCFSIVQPILRTLTPEHPFAKSLVMGIALASNVGGMTSPISSPQNIFAIERMVQDGKPPSWLCWFAVALPVSFVCILVCWVLILMVYQPWTAIKEVRPLKPAEDPLTKTQVFVIVVSVSTVVLWCLNSALAKVTGEMGVIAIIPMVAFFGFGVLNKDDFNGFLWNVVMLAMGGVAMGEAVKSSGLLATIAQGIKELVSGMDLWQILTIFCGLVLVCATFISHTVGAMVILPIVQQVGETALGHPHPRLLVMGAALMCSGAMGLPVSGFPNMNAISLEDATGKNYVNTLDFVWVGVPSSVFAYIIVVTVGYFLMLLIGF